jgi:plastocyanin
MLKLPSMSLVSLFLLAFPMTVFAETHDVMVFDFLFSPNDLTINVGDTVRWTNAPGNALHDVVDDKFRWRSETSNAFTYSKTFDTAEEVLYHCSVHSSPGGNRNTRMNGRITVEGVSAPPFLINAGISDAWFFPGTSGQGFFIIVWEDQQTVFLAWFTYETERPPDDVSAILGEPGHRWIIGLGAYDGDTALLDVFLSSGMIFDSGVPPVDTVQYPGATIEIIWSSCSEGLVKYNIPTLMLMGEVPIQRIAEDNVPACLAAQPVAE